LYERTSPCDLYDVVYILDNPPGLLHFEQTHELFKRKCSVKALSVPTVQSLAARAYSDEELRSEWVNMLAHQLPDLPDLDTLLGRLAELLTWIEQPTVVSPGRALTPTPVHAGESSVGLAGIRYWGGGVPLETIRFAGANRLLVEFMYHGKLRLVEPYSLRRAATGNILLYAWELDSHQIKAFKVGEISGLRSTHTPFTPRFQIELTSSEEPLAIAATSAGHQPRSYTASRTRLPSRQLKTGPVYVFRCPYCGKEFRHGKNDAKLRKHKDAGGTWDCPGRRGYYGITLSPR